MPDTTAIAKELRQLLAEANPPELECFIDPDTPVMDYKADKYVYASTGSIKGLEAYGDGDCGFMTPEMAQLITKAINHLPAILDRLEGLENMFKEADQEVQELERKLGIREPQL